MRIATQDSSLQRHHKEPHVFEHGYHRPHVQAPSTCPSDRQLPAPLRLRVNTLVAGPPRGGQTAWKQDGVVCVVKSGSLELSLLPEPRKFESGLQETRRSRFAGGLPASSPSHLPLLGRLRASKLPSFSTPPNRRITSELPGPLLGRPATLL